MTERINTAINILVYLGKVMAPYYSICLKYSRGNDFSNCMTEPCNNLLASVNTVFNRNTNLEFVDFAVIIYFHYKVSLYIRRKNH